jgi:hypothetical protein
MTSQLIINNENPQRDLGPSLVDSFLSREVTGIAASLTDVILSELTSEDILGRVPIFGAIFNFYKGCISISDQLFLRKIAYFLAGCKKKDSSEKTEFQQQLAIDHKLRVKVGEDLLLILEGIENFEKAAAIGKVFMGRLRGDIDEDTFFKLATAIKNASIADLRALERSYKRIATYDPKAGKPFSDSLDDATAQSLYTVGLVRADGYMETLYLHNELGNQLLTLLNAE